MEKISKIFASLLAVSSMLISCTKETPVSEQNVKPVDFAPVTKACVASPKVVAMVETNDVNPLNAMDYVCGGQQFFDIVELFAANIHKETVDGVDRPTLYLNDKLTPILEGGLNTYVKPLQDAGIKVLLTVLGDWQGIGLANMNETQADQFAHILAYAVQQYNLDGIGFDDEYADYQGALVNGSFGNIIKKLHALLPADKLITVFAYGTNLNQIDEAAGAMIDYAYTDFSYWNGSPNISGVANAHWAPSAYNLGNSYMTPLVKSRAATAKNNGYGAIMTFNLRQKSNVDPMPVLQAISDGLGCGSVSCEDGDRPRTAGSVPSGYTITYQITTGN